MARAVGWRVTPAMGARCLGWIDVELDPPRSTDYRGRSPMLRKGNASQASTDWYGYRKSESLDGHHPWRAWLSAPCEAMAAAFEIVDVPRESDRSP
jgi:hypothetical protein